MSRKILMACMAVTALVAFALPAAASAENTPLITAPTGTTLATGSAITATNEGNTLFESALGNVECHTATLTGTLRSNTTGTVEGDIETASFKNHSETHCTGLGGTTVTPSPVATTGLPWCLRSTKTMATDEFQIRGNKCSGAQREITFTLHPTSIGLACSYSRSAAIPGIYTTHPTKAQLSISKVEFKRENSSIFCPSAGFLTMKFNLTSNGNTVFIDV